MQNLEGFGAGVGPNLIFRVEAGYLVPDRYWDRGTCWTPEITATLQTLTIHGAMRRSRAKVTGPAEISVSSDGFGRRRIDKRRDMSLDQ